MQTYVPFDFGLTESQEQRATSLHEAAVIIDGLGGSMLRRPSPEVNGLDRIGQYLTNGVTVTNETMAAPAADARSAMHALFDYHCLAQVDEGRTLAIRTTDDILRCKREGRLGVLTGFQGANPFEDDLSLVYVFHELGLRITNLVYNKRNLLGSGISEAVDEGLTAYGHQVVHELNRLGITLDLSHTALGTSLDALKATRAPAVFSHSNAKRLTEHSRNLTDEQIRAAADTGGLVGLCPHSMFNEKSKGVRPTLTDFFEHFDYMVDLVGIDHVAIGTDLFGGQNLSETVYRFKLGLGKPGSWGGYGIEEKYVIGFDNVYGWLNITRGLVSKGLSDEDVLKVLGGNWLRVFRDTWGAS